MRTQGLIDALARRDVEKVVLAGGLGMLFPLAPNEAIARVGIVGLKNVGLRPPRDRGLLRFGARRV